MAASKEEKEYNEMLRRQKEAEEMQQEASDWNALLGGRAPRVESEVERDLELVKVHGESSKKRSLLPAVDDKGQALIDPKTGKAIHTAISLPTVFAEIFDSDITLANLSAEEQKVVIEHVNLSNYVQSLQELTGINFTYLQEFYKNQMKAFLLTSRAKSGFAAMLMKTEKTISEGTLKRWQEQQKEEHKRRWLPF